MELRFRGNVVKAGPGFRQQAIDALVACERQQARRELMYVVAALVLAVVSIGAAILVPGTWANIIAVGVILLLFGAIGMQQLSVKVPGVEASASAGKERSE